MTEPPDIAHSGDKHDAVDHNLLLQQAQALMAGQRNPLVNAANLSALLFHGLPLVNWVGFYFTVANPDSDGDPYLLLGPFQGLPACIELPWGQGVCGTAAKTREPQRVADVHAFSGHIPCDSASRSELVMPLVAPLKERQTVVGVLDLDSPQRDRFTQRDEDLVVQIAAAYLRASDLEPITRFYR